MFSSTVVLVQQGKLKEHNRLIQSRYEWIRDCFDCFCVYLGKSHCKHWTLEAINAAFLLSLQCFVTPSSPHPTRISRTMDHPGRYWCMCCFHLSTIHYDPYRIIPFRVHCLMGEGDAPCARCSQRNALCEPVRSPGRNHLLLNSLIASALYGNPRWCAGPVRYSRLDDSFLVAIW